MRRFINIVALITFIGFANSSLAEQKFGTGADSKSVMKISELTKNADKFEGKEVTVDGLVTEVCAKRGCWMTVQSDEKFKDIRIKVKDGEMVFPLSARGKTATVKGIFTSKKLTLEQTIEFKKHIAEENKLAFDQSKIKDPMTVYQVNATGVVIN